MARTRQTQGRTTEERERERARGREIIQVARTEGGADPPKNKSAGRSRRHKHIAELFRKVATVKNVLDSSETKAKAFINAVEAGTKSSHRAGASHAACEALHVLAKQEGLVVLRHVHFEVGEEPEGARARRQPPRSR